MNRQTILPCCILSLLRGKRAKAEKERLNERLTLALLKRLFQSRLDAGTQTLNNLNLVLTTASMKYRILFSEGEKVRKSEREVAH